MATTRWVGEQTRGRGRIHPKNLTIVARVEGDVVDPYSRLSGNSKPQSHIHILIWNNHLGAELPPNTAIALASQSPYSGSEARRR